MINILKVRIIKTTPNTGQRVERGDSVDVVISKRPTRKVKMPNVIGLPIMRALREIKIVRS